MKNFKVIYLLALPVFLISLSNCSMFKKSVSTEGISLNYILKPDKAIKVSSDIITKFETEQMGQVTTIDMKSSSIIGFKALSSEEPMNMELEFVKMAQSMDSPMGSQDTDFSKLIGKKAGFKLSSGGDVTEPSGFDKLPEITNAAGEKLSGEMYEQVAQSIFFELPDHPVTIGDTWTEKDSTEMPYAGGILKTISNTTYRVVEKLVVDGMNCLRFDVNGTTTTGGEFEQNGTQLIMDRNAALSGYIIFAYEEGMYLSMDIDTNTKGTIDVPVAGMTIPQTISSKTKIGVSW